jgi:hypothetical protein
MFCTTPFSGKSTTRSCGTVNSPIRFAGSSRPSICRIWKPAHRQTEGRSDQGCRSLYNTSSTAASIVCCAHPSLHIEVRPEPLDQRRFCYVRNQFAKNTYPPISYTDSVCRRHARFPFARREARRDYSCRSGQDTFNEFRIQTGIEI